jgi:hypothetical protein
MERKAMCSNQQNSESDIEQDLWSALLHAKGVSSTWDGSEAPTEGMFAVVEDPAATAPYAWNPLDPESEEFFTHLEQSFSLDDWSAEETATRSQAFFGKLNQLWSTTTLQESLVERFATRVPQQLLGAIVAQAQQALTTSQSLADQLVQCVSTILPNMAQDDLLVLTRPLAYAMRNGESRRAVDATLEKIRPVAWEELSDIEQARLSLAIARYALAELEVQE